MLIYILFRSKLLLSLIETVVYSCKLFDEHMVLVPDAITETTFTRVHRLVFRQIMFDSFYVQ
jgi:hypothetical protein